MANWRHSLVWLFMLLAASGPLPLCLHHSFCHSPNSTSADEPTGSSCTAHSHSHATCSVVVAKGDDSPKTLCCSTKRTKVPTALVVSPYENHDCRLCYELAQPISRGLIEFPPQPNDGIVVVLNDWQESAAIHRLFSPVSLRGPPRVS